MRVQCCVCCVIYLLPITVGLVLGAKWVVAWLGPIIQ